MSNVFVIIRMCYVHNQWYDISCATLYIYIYIYIYIYMHTHTHTHTHCTFFWRDDIWTSWTSCLRLCFKIDYPGRGMFFKVRFLCDKYKKCVTKYHLSAGCGEWICSFFCEMIAKHFHHCAAFFLLHSFPR